MSAPTIGDRVEVCLASGDREWATIIGFHSGQFLNGVELHAPAWQVQWDDGLRQWIDLDCVVSR